MADCAAAADLTRVWDLGVRLFHWLLVAAVAIALVTGLSGPRNVLNVHVAAGAAIGGLVAFRVLWGVIGSTYAPPTFPFSARLSTRTSPGLWPAAAPDTGDTIRLAA